MSWAESWWIAKNTVKSIQRGSTTSAQIVAINEVDLARAIVLSVSKGSAGYVAARGSINGNSAIKNGDNTYIKFYSTSGKTTTDTYSSQGSYVALNGALSGGTTDLTVKEYSARLISSTQIQTDGACEWQVIEFY